MIKYRLLGTINNTYAIERNCANGTKEYYDFQSKGRHWWTIHSTYISDCMIKDKKLATKVLNRLTNNSDELGLAIEVKPEPPKGSTIYENVGKSFGDLGKGAGKLFKFKVKWK